MAIPRKAIDSCDSVVDVYVDRSRKSWPALGDVFDAREVKLLEEVVSEAPTSFERVTAVAQFLCAHMCPREPFSEINGLAGSR